MQLNKYLALCGAASRRKANDLIASHRVTVNGKSVVRLGMQVEPGSDTVALDGRVLHPARRFRYVLLNKPRGFITAVSDARGKRTVIDLVQGPRGMFPVGRLDMDTEGVLLLTNDGELAHRLLHPRFEIDKIYHAWVAGEFGEAQVRQFGRGVAIEPGLVVRGEARVVRRIRNRTLVEVRIHEGRKRQVRLMCKALGFPVEHLERVNFAGLTVRGLAAGEWRELRTDELRMLKRTAGMEKEERKKDINGKRFSHDPQS
jgi:pseudouridine synthase